MVGTQPLTQPLASVIVHRSIGFADRTETEVVGPPNDHAVELRYHHLLVQQGLIPPSQLTNRRADALHPLLRGNRTNVRTARLRQIAVTERVAQEIEFLFRQLIDFVSFTVNFSFVMMHRIRATLPRDHSSRSPDRRR